MHYKLSKQSIHTQYMGNIYNFQLRDFLTGRIWLRDHSPFAEKEIERHIKLGYISILPGIQQLKNANNKLFQQPTYQCNRCHNKNPHYFAQFQCANCDTICVYCRHCIRMGRVSSCTELITWTGPKPPISKNHQFHWCGTFTPQQQRAANELITSVKRNRSHLIHAVCGAGKTEILFPAIYECLRKGKRVCVATPRTDVVLELAPRIQKVFPNTFVQALYGGADAENRYSPLIISTTHQLYRFQHAFDMIIVDEADAFPYTFDETLQQAVTKAKKPDVPSMFVTATPSEKLLATVKKQQDGYSFIPRRYHGHPLPVPRYDTLWRYNKKIEKGKLPSKLVAWINKRLEHHEPFLIFFPTIALMEKATPLFQKLNSSIEAVHAEDPDRKEKVLALRANKVPGLLTTTILERGITIPKVQLAIVGAESGIFTASALIQIGGRVGRSFDCPNGDLVFFHHGISLEMDVARQEIIRLNRTEVIT